MTRLPLLPVIQAVAVVPAIAEVLTIEKIGVGVATLFLLAFWRQTTKLRDEVIAKFNRLDVALYGEKGDDGMNGRVKNAEAQLVKLSRDIQEWTSAGFRDALRHELKDVLLTHDEERGRR